MKSEFILSCIFIFCAFIAHYFNLHDKYKTVDNVVHVVTSTCFYPEAGLYRDGPYERSLEFCGDRMSLSSLVNHMKIHGKGMDAVMAVEFGVNTKVGVLLTSDFVVVNPILIKTSSIGIECSDMIGGSIITKLRPSNLTIETYNGELMSRRDFYENESCLIHGMLETMGII